MTLFLSTTATPVALVANVKLAVAAAAFAPDLDVQFGVLGLKTDKVELVEPNAIVQYLAKDFAESAVYGFDDEAYRDMKRGASPAFGAPPQNHTLCPANIVLFALAHVHGQLPEWTAEFMKHPAVARGLKKAKSRSRDGLKNIKAGYLVKPQDGAILPKDNERNILITSALPYVNNVPHLGNIIGSVLSADIYARFCKNRNYNCLFVCGTDEYGTATETKALEEKVTPKELCDKFHKIHKDVYDWFDIDFDYFGRTTTELQTEIAQDIFLKLHQNGYLEEQTQEQLYCETHKAFLADRYVEGRCPKCSYEDARGDQCDKCGNLLDPLELLEPRCKLDGAQPVRRHLTHVYLRLNALEPELREWVQQASEKGSWLKNSRTITNSWLKEGLEPRCITRDLVWGTPVPLEKFHDKVLYVWFDATIGYVSITANYFKDRGVDGWRRWWQSENVDLYQFMGKDNVPFHTVVFPASQIGTRDPWTKLHHLNTTEYLQYESGKFSKSRGVGVFGNNAQELGIPPSVWRYYLASVRPESLDLHFSWDDLVAKNNSELLANLGNLVNRVVKFAIAKYAGVVPDYKTLDIKGYAAFEEDVNGLLAAYIKAMEAVSLRRGLELAMAISARGNQFLQENKLDNSLFEQTPRVSDAVVGVALNLIYLVLAVVSPFMPATRDQICDILQAPPLLITDKLELVLQPGHNIGKAQYLFKRIEEGKVAQWRALYGGQTGK